MVTALSSSEIAAVEVTEIPSSRLWRLSVVQYHEMLRAGILREDDPVELIEGVLVQKMGKNPPHVVALTLMRDLILRLGLQGWTLRIQDPIALNDSEPEPDLVLAKGTVTDYCERHPLPAQIGVVIEVAETSLLEDRGFKKCLYARNRIGQYWIVNLVDEQVEVYTEPFGSGAKADYCKRSLYSPGESVPLVLEANMPRQVPVMEFL